VIGGLVRARYVHRAAVVVLWTATAATVGVLLFMVVFVFERGAPHVTWPFLTSAATRAGATGGIFATIVATLYVTAIGILVATPLGVGAAIHLAEYTREGHLTQIIRGGTESLAGIPSIIFGLFGFAFFVTQLGLGWSMLSGGLTLALMILPTVIRTSEEALRAVPREYREVAQSLGASKWQAVTRAVLPSAAPGILTGIILGTGRAVSETAALIFTAGVALRSPASLFDSGRTMSVHFYILTMEGISDRMAYATATVLVVTILAINMAAYGILAMVTRGRRR
jgi:phosphate transport system permease protein